MLRLFFSVLILFYDCFKKKAFLLLEIQNLFWYEIDVYYCILGGSPSYRNLFTWAFCLHVFIKSLMFSKRKGSNDFPFLPEYADLVSDSWQRENILTEHKYCESPGKTDLPQGINYMALVSMAAVRRFSWQIHRKILYGKLVNCPGRMNSIIYRFAMNVW